MVVPRMANVVVILISFSISGVMVTLVMISVQPGRCSYWNGLWWIRGLFAMTTCAA